MIDQVSLSKENSSLIPYCHCEQFAIFALCCFYILRIIHPGYASYEEMHSGQNKNNEQLYVALRYINFMAS